MVWGLRSRLFTVGTLKWVLPYIKIIDPPYWRLYHAQKYREMRDIWLPFELQANFEANHLLKFLDHLGVDGEDLQLYSPDRTSKDLKRKRSLRSSIQGLYKHSSLASSLDDDGIKMERDLPDKERWKRMRSGERGPSDEKPDEDWSELETRLDLPSPIR